MCSRPLLVDEDGISGACVGSRRLYSCARWDFRSTVFSRGEHIELFEMFAGSGFGEFVVRFGAFDQREQLRRFAEDVLPEVR